MSGTKWVVRRPDKAMPQVWDQHGRACVTDRVFDEHEDLIAAAPELLAACELVAEYRDLIKQNYPDLAGLIRGLELAKAAIAKAEGRGS